MTTLIQFLSYEGSFMAVGGPADGQISMDVGVIEAGTTPIGQSLQLSGSGSAYADFTWQMPAASTFGSLNTNQTLVTTYIFDNAWVPNDPSDIGNPSTAANNIVVQNGIATVAGSFVANNLTVNANAVFNVTSNFEQNAITIDADGELTIGANTTLGMRGSITNSGMFDSTLGTVSFQQPGAFALTGAGTFNIGNLLLNVDTFTFESPNCNLFGALQPLNTTQINFNNNLTFKSTSTRTGVIDAINGTTFSGSVTVERFIPQGNRAFRLLTAPLANAASINATWQEGQTNIGSNYPADNINTTPAMGTHITGVGGSMNGFDQTTTNNSSMFTVNEQASPAEYTAITNTLTTNLQEGEGYLILIRGDRSVDLGMNNPPHTATTLRASGNLLSGDFVVTDLNPGTDDSLPGGNGSTLVGNPYQSPVDMAGVLSNATNINPNFYHIYDPTISSRGAFVTIRFGADDTMDSTNFSNPEDPANPGATATTTATRYLQPGQAAFVNTDLTLSLLAPPSLTFRQSDISVFKVDNTSGSFRPARGKNALNNSSTLSVALYNTKTINTGTPKDALVVDFNDAYDNALESLDARKPVNLDENIATVVEGKNISIQSHATPVDGDELPIFISNYRSDDYTFKVDLSNTGTAGAFLIDNYLNVKTELLENETTLIQFLVNSDDLTSIASDRFKIVFEERSLNTEDPTATNFNVYPNPVKDGILFLQTQGIAGEISFFNIIGQKVLTSEIPETESAINVSSLPPGVYIVEFNSNDTTATKKIIIQ